MNIVDAIKNYCKSSPKNCGFIVPTDEDGYWNINIQFINSENNEDETQFDVKPYLFDYGSGKCDDLVELWKEFCRENKFKQNSVTSINIVGGW